MKNMLSVLNILSCMIMVTVVGIDKSQGWYIHDYQMDTENHLNIAVPAHHMFSLQCTNFIIHQELKPELSNITVYCLFSNKQT